jgi:hypothetical protein
MHLVEHNQMIEKSTTNRSDDALDVNHSAMVSATRSDGRGFPCANPPDVSWAEGTIVIAKHMNSFVDLALSPG